MNIITKRRTLRPSNRDTKSIYKINTSKITENEILRIEIDHEDSPKELIAMFELSGHMVAEKNSIHFHAIQSSEGWLFKWYNIQPTRIL